MKYVYLLGAAASLVLVTGHLFRAWMRRQPDLALDIRPPLPKFGKLTPAEVAQVERKAAQRRKEADQYRLESHKVATGHEERFKIVRSR